MMEKKWLELAMEAQRNAYAPYSKIKVGAALVAHSGAIYKGCNVENASYGLALCAERSALVSAVSAGERRFRALVLVSDGKVLVTPCGACRQVLYEFSPQMEVIVIRDKKVIRKKLTRLLPHAFILRRYGTHP